MNLYNKDPNVQKRLERGETVMDYARRKREAEQLLAEQTAGSPKSEHVAPEPQAEPQPSVPTTHVEPKPKPEAKPVPSRGPLPVRLESIQNKLYEAFTARSDPLRSKHIKPVAQLILVGPHGVGKRMLVEELARHYIGNFQEPPLTAIDCTEYTKDFDVVNILGAPPGYIAHDPNFVSPLSQESIEEPHRRSEAHWPPVVRMPYRSVVLFSEYTKSCNMLIRIMRDKIRKTGSLQLTNGQITDFSRTVVALTTDRNDPHRYAKACSGPETVIPVDCQLTREDCRRLMVGLSIPK